MYPPNSLGSTKETKPPPPVNSCPALVRGSAKTWGVSVRRDITIIMKLTRPNNNNQKCWGCLKKQLNKKNVWCTLANIVKRIYRIGRLIRWYCYQWLKYVYTHHMCIILWGCTGIACATEPQDDVDSCELREAKYRGQWLREMRGRVHHVRFVEFVNHVQDLYLVHHMPKQVLSGNQCSLFQFFLVFIACHRLKLQTERNDRGSYGFLPKGSMYGIFTYIWSISMINVLPVVGE